MRRDEKIITELTALAELFQYQLSELALDLYLRVLEPFTIEEISKAISLCAQELKFYPKPSELIERIKPKQDLKSEAIIAWEKFESKCRTSGCYHSVTFDDAAIAWACQSFGGWPECYDLHYDLDDKAHQHFRYQWQQAYIAYLGNKGLINFRLTGLHELKNRAAGFLDSNDILTLPSGEKINPTWLEPKPKAVEQIAAAPSDKVSYLVGDIGKS